MSHVHRSSWQGLEHLEARQLLAFVVWDGGGGDTDWDNPLNWSGDALPGATDNVLIDAPGSPTITRSHNTGATIASLWSLDALNISDGTLTIAGQWKQSAPLFMSGGRVVQGGNAIINGEALWIGGEILGAGNVLVYPGHQLTIDGDVTLGSSLYNNGSLRWASGDIATNGGSIQNLAGRTFTILSSGTLASIGPTTTLINYGTLIREGPGTTTINVRFSNFPANILVVPFPPAPPPPLPPAGVVDVRDGTLAFTGPVVEKQGDRLDGNGTWKVSSSTAKLLLPGPDLVYAHGTYVLSGAGASFPQLESVFNIDNLTLAAGRAFSFANLSGLYGTLGSLTIDSPGAVLSIPALGTSGLHIIAGDVRLNNGLVGQTVTVETGASLTLRGQSYFSYAQISGGGLIRLEGSLRWVGGEISGPGQLLITTTGSITNSGQYWENGFKVLTRRTINYGTITFSQNLYGSDGLAISTELVNRGTLNLYLYGFLGTNAGTGPVSAPAFINNFGTINSTGNLTLRGAGGGVRLINNGTVHVSSGTLILNGGSAGGGSWIVDSGAELAFGGLGSTLASPVFVGLGRIRQAATAYWSNVLMSGLGELLNTVPARLTLSGTSTSITRLSIRNDGVLSFAAGATTSFIANTYNSGELNLGTSVLNVFGDLNLNPTSRVTSRSTSASDPARLVVSGNTDLKGSLAVTFTWAATPGFYNFLTTAHHSGVFASTTGIGLPPGTMLLFQFFGTSGKFSVATL